MLSGVHGALVGFLVLSCFTTSYIHGRQFESTIWEQDE